MPTILEGGPEYNKLIFNYDRSWTDDLPICKVSGVGYLTRQRYDELGQRREELESEDISLRCCYDDAGVVWLYGIFNGHNGAETARFARDRIAAEILLGQLPTTEMDQTAKEIIQQSFLSVEGTYLETIDNKLLQRANLLLQLPEGISHYDAYQQYPQIIEKLKELEEELSCGTGASIAILKNNRLYVANVGESRVLLCKTDKDDVMRVIQPTVDHNLTNLDEVMRLTNLGLNISDGKINGAYKDYEELSAASAEPVIAEPHIVGGITIDSSYRFMMIASPGLLKTLEEATGTNQVNKELALLVVEQLRVQSTLTGVAQAVVDHIARIYHDTYEAQDNAIGATRPNIMLMIRNFNFAMPNAITEQQHSWNGSYDQDTAVNFTETTTSTSTDPSSGSVKAILPYVDFSEFNSNVNKAKAQGKLPSNINFFYE
ncbi:PREDICTED: TGF-beta-activated kinase 1 and MAP3K7-binding protein 1-like isoform X3 [Diuraphis noxia]|uniref:TGF-beta-activated kinase 1 and MAP3K7-binding protein 1-like isoform X3 n=1 Tax=Diuraphis noxia TaxID=143948 RepID=UPI000763B7A2|nr:PREDICTED: TGF-beta-activated kinase 1 and MAP3K7-binding protein 1-like isoform X3 [Diuraphis noxia]